MRKTKKTLAILAIVAMVLAMIPVQVFAATTSAADSDRYAGADRIGTALAVAANWTSADAVVLAPADDANLVDALAAAPLAGQENAPILLTYKAELSADVKAKITALGAKKVYVVGAAANDAVVNALTGVTVEKLTGADRVDTAAFINAKLTSPAGTFVVGYDATADALSAASYAAANKYAIVLAGPDKNVDASKILGSKTYVVGGTGVVNDVAGAPRFGGADRYATNTEVVKGLSYEYSKVYIANGETLADALVAAPLAAQAKAAVLLADPYNSSVAAASEVNAKLTSTSKVIALGGTGVVSDAVKGSVSYTAPAVLSVESVSAINLKQVEVKFNKVMDEASVETPGMYTVYDNGSSTAVAGVFVPVLQSDDKTVRLTLVNDATAKLTNFSKAKVVISKNVLDENGNKLGADYTASNIVVSDSAAPTVVSVTQSEPTKLKVKFSEAVKDADGGLTIDTANFKLDSGAYIVTGAAVDLDKQQIELTIGGDVAAGDHTLQVNPSSSSDIVDFAGNKVALKSDFTFTLAGDAVAPTATIDKVSQTSVTFKFSEKIVNAKDANISYRHSVNNTTYEVLGTSANVTVDDSNADYTKVTVNFSAAGFPLPEGSNIPVYIAYKSTASGYTAIKDNFNNKYAATTYNVAVTADKTAPTATVALVPGSNTQFEVTYSEAVNGATTASNYTVKDSNDNTVTMTGSPVKQTGNVYRLTASAAMSGSYTVEIKNIEDTAVVANKMATTTLSFTVADEIKPYVVEQDGTFDSLAVYTLKDAKNVRVYFSEAMNTSDLTDLTKYQNKADSYKNPTEAKAAANGKSVDLKFEADVTNGNGLVIGQLRDVAGNKMEQLATAVTAVTTHPTIGLKATDSDWKSSVIATSTTTIKVYLNVLVTEISAADFEIEKNGAGTWVAPATVSAATEDGKSVLTLTLSDANKMSEALWGDTAPVGVRTVSAAATPGAANGTKDAAGVKIQFAATDSTDAIAPSLASSNPIQAVDIDADGKIDHIKVSFKEKVSQSYVSTDKFTVEGYTVKDAYSVTVPPTSATARTGATVADGKDVYVRVEEKSSVDYDAKPTVTIAAGIKDLADNAFAFSATATTALAGATGAAGTFAVTTQGVDAVAKVEASKTGSAAPNAGVNDSSANTLNVIVNGGAPVAVTITGIDGSEADGSATATELNTAIDTAIGSDKVDVSFGAGAFTFVTKGTAATGVTPSIAFTGTSLADFGLTTDVTSGTAGVAAVAEVATFTITSGATAAGTLAVTVNGVVTYVTLAATDDTAADVATAIAGSLSVTDWTVAASGSTVTITDNDGTPSVETDLTGSIK